MNENEAVDTSAQSVADNGCAPVETIDAAAPLLQDNTATESNLSAHICADLTAVENRPDPTPAQCVSADGGSAVKRDRAKTRKIVRFVFSGLGIAVVLFLLFVVIVLAVDKFVKKSPVPSFFGTSTLIVTTGSMAGTIDDGDLIVVNRADEYKIGDIITFLPDGDTIPTTHRIIRITDDGKFYTKGDANNAEDTFPIKQSNIIGKVTYTVPHVGLFFGWIKNEFGWVYIVAIVIVIVAGIVLLKQFPAAKKEK